MNKRIVYQSLEGNAVVICPVLDCGLTLEEIAQKDVPAGVPYKIINVEDLPPDRTFRNAWQAIIQQPDGYGIGHEAWYNKENKK